MIAALFVEKGGIYYGRENVDCWDVERDARTYPGNWPVVAHPPCARWSKLAYIHGRVGEDEGCFASALENVRRYGGVLEHPVASAAWPRFGLPRPVFGCWRRGLFDCAWVTSVNQSAYGHKALKPTWLYFVGEEPPPLNWVRSEVKTTVQNMDSKGVRAKTPPAFAEILIAMAESVRR